MTTETDEERLHRICCSARDTYFNEEQAGKFPNLALIIRDAVLDYAAPAAPSQDALDAKRYRWLRNTLELAFPRIIDKKWWINLGEQSGSGFDLVVDAAMRAKGGA